MDRRGGSTLEKVVGRSPSVSPPPPVPMLPARSTVTTRLSKNVLLNEAAVAGGAEVRDALQRARMAGYRAKMEGGSNGPRREPPGRPGDSEASLKRIVEDFTRSVGGQSALSSYARQKPWGHGGEKLSFVARPSVDPNQLGWGAYDLKDPIQKDQSRIEKPAVRGFDEKHKQRFVYQQAGFSAQLDRKLGFQYSDKFNIKQMREEIFSIMSKINKTGHYSQYRSRAASLRGAGTFDQDMDPSVQEENVGRVSRVRKPAQFPRNHQTSETGESPEKEEETAPATVKKDERAVGKMAGINSTTADKRGKAIDKDGQKLLGHQRTANNTTSRMDSILSVLASNAELSTKKGKLLRGESTNSRLLPTQNSLQADPFDVSSAIVSQSPDRRLSEFKLIVDNYNCPRFRKMKDIGADVTSKLRQEVMRARHVSALASKKGKGFGVNDTPGSLAYLARHFNYGSSFDHTHGPRAGNLSSMKASQNGPISAHDQAKSHNALMPAGGRDPHMNLSMDVGGMQINVPATSAANSPQNFAGSLEHQHASQLAAKLRHLNESFDNT